MCYLLSFRCAGRVSFLPVFGHRSCSTCFSDCFILLSAVNKYLYKVINDNLLKYATIPYNPPFLSPFPSYDDC